VFLGKVLEIRLDGFIFKPPVPLSNKGGVGFVDFFESAV